MTFSKRVGDWSQDTEQTALLKVFMSMYFQYIMNPIHNEIG